jgi:hypothetical protein
VTGASVTKIQRFKLEVQLQGSSLEVSYFYINLNNRHASNGSLSNVLSRLAVGVRVDGDDETRWKEHEREGDQGEKRANASEGARAWACPLGVPSECTDRDRRELNLNLNLNLTGRIHRNCCVPCVLKVTQTHNHIQAIIHTHTFTPWAGYRAGAV